MGIGKYMKSKIIVELDLEKMLAYPQYVANGGSKPHFYWLLKGLEDVGKMILTVVKDNLPDDKRDNIHEALRWVEEMTEPKEEKND